MQQIQYSVILRSMVWKLLKAEQGVDKACAPVSCVFAAAGKAPGKRRTRNDRNSAPMQVCWVHAHFSERACIVGMRCMCLLHRGASPAHM
jgi:hypothetical protein